MHDARIAGALLRDCAARILRAALKAVDPRAAVRRALELQGETLRIEEEVIDLGSTERVLVVGAGKAGPGMAQGALDALGPLLSGGTLTTKEGHGYTVPGIEVREAAHPLPDACGVAGAEAALRLAAEAGERDLLLCLLSGGASALWAAPPDGVSLEDLQAVTDALLRAGASIGELNTVRKHLSRLTGGQLARAAYPARVASLILSDVVGSPLEVIASGPTVPDPTTYLEAIEVLAAYGVRAPTTVRIHLEKGAAGVVPETPKPGDPALAGVVNHIVARNLDALRGAAGEAEALGYGPLILTSRLEGEAREVGRVVAGLALDVRNEGLPLTPPAALLLGGETTVTVRGEGKGGRNQEMALAAALALEGEEGVLVACLGTDGTDGPTNAAGGVVDGGTVGRGREGGLDPRDHLDRNDAYPFLQAAGDLLVTGPTGTNVNDVVLVLVEG